ncbi:MAG: tetraacyldisaccharide 4'-kinase [Prolixibacteraceae bacterium]|nr:tetraacyldisaccharide 4'-kinase [Prolixibacteraceae bacterium]
MLKLFLYPLSWLYGFGIYLRNQAYDLNLINSKEFDVPVISIGNITVGGTGKTPHVEHIVKLLRDNFIVATLSRGYKRKTSGFLYVNENSKATEVGDEPLQIKRKFPKQTVSVCEKRVVGVEKLLASDGEQIPDVVILDDAFQHRRIIPGINILLIDYNRPIKNDTLLPAGRLREGVAQMRRANIIIFTKCPEEVTPIMRRILQSDVGLKPYQSLFFSTLVYGKPTPVFNGKLNEKAFYNDKLFSILLVAGIASPKPMQKHVQQFSKKLEAIFYPDHHFYQESDIQHIMQDFNAITSEYKIIITTEKDSMRIKDIENLPDEFKKSLFYLPVEVRFLENEGKEFNKKIMNYVGENKSNRELHKRTNKSAS